jgi:hypothetical protein
MSTLAGDGNANTDVASSDDVVPARDGGDPFRVFGIVGFVLSLFAILNFAGLAISIIALICSKRAGFRNRFARGRCYRGPWRARDADHRLHRCRRAR